MWYRWSAWKAAVDLNVEEHMYNYDFHKMNSANENTCLIDKQINKDVHRTFPQEPFFSEAQYENKSIESLRRVLKALSRYFEKVGYC